MEPRNYVHVLIVHTQYCCDYERVTQIVQKITKTSCNIPAAVRCCIKNWKNFNRIPKNKEDKQRMCKVTMWHATIVVVESQ